MKEITRINHVGLRVTDLETTRAFYEKLGFITMGGEADNGWLMLKQGDHIIGLFQGMFDKNILTFNPGWDQQSNETESFTDVREIQRKLREQGVALASEADEASEGPASIMLLDPDGNPDPITIAARAAVIRLVASSVPVGTRVRSLVAIDGASGTGKEAIVRSAPVSRWNSSIRPTSIL